MTETPTTRTAARIRDALDAWVSMLPASAAPSADVDERSGVPARRAPRRRAARPRRGWVPTPRRLGVALGVGVGGLALVSLLLVVVTAGSGGEDEVATVTASPSAASPAPALSLPGAAAVGRFFAVVEINGDSYPDEQRYQKVVRIRDAGTGAATATVAMPDEIDTWYSASGTSVPGVFYVAGADIMEPTPTGSSSIYRLDVDSNGAVAALTKLPVPEPINYMIWSLAASPDGSRIAFADGRRTPRTPGIHVLDVASGVTTSYTADLGGRVATLSWDANGRYIGFELSGPRDLADEGIWVLDTAATGGLTEHSTRVPMLSFKADTRSGTLLSPDAQHFYYLMYVEPGPEWMLVQLDVATGVERELRRFQSGVELASYALALSPDGSELLMVKPDGWGYRIALSDFAVTELSVRAGGPSSVGW